MDEKEIQDIGQTNIPKYPGPAEGYGRHIFIQIMRALQSDDEEIICWYGADYCRDGYSAKDNRSPFSNIRDWGGKERITDTILKRYIEDKQAIEEQQMSSKLQTVRLYKPTRTGRYESLFQCRERLKGNRNRNRKNEVKLNRLLRLKQQQNKKMVLNESLPNLQNYYYQWVNKYYLDELIELSLTY